MNHANTLSPPASPAPRVLALVGLFVGLLVWNDAAQWTHVGAVPLGLALPVALLVTTMFLPPMTVPQAQRPLWGALFAVLAVGAVGLWRGRETLDIALPQAQLSLGALWLVVLVRTLPRAQVPTLLHHVTTIGTPVLVARMVLHAVQKLPHSEGELRLLHVESDVAAAATFLIVLLVYADHFRPRWWHVALVAANAGVLVVTFKRSGLIGLLAVAAVYMALRGRERLPPAVRTLGIVGACIGAVLLFALTMSADLSAYVADRLHLSMSGSTLWRFAAWRDGWSLWTTTSSVWGVGYGRQPISILLDFSQHLSLHNAPLALWVHLGLPGVVTFAVLWGLVARQAVLVARSTDRATSDLGVLSLMASVYLAIFMAFNPALETLSTGPIIWLFLAVPLTVDTPAPRERTAGWALGAVVLAAFVWVALPKHLPGHTLYSAQAGGKLPWATWGETEPQTVLHRGDALTLVPPGVSDARARTLAWTWLLPEWVNAGRESLAGGVVRVTFNRPPSHPLAYNLLDDTGDALPGLVHRDVGVTHEFTVSVAAGLPHYVIVSDIDPADRDVVIESVVIARP